VLVEDGREGKEHPEFAQAWTSCLFGIAVGSGCMDFSCMQAVILSNLHFE
jgi:hypothetical protein